MTLLFSNLSFRFLTVTHSASKLNDLIFRALHIYLDILTCLPLSVHGKNLVHVCRPQASNHTLTRCEVPEQDWSYKHIAQTLYRAAVIYKCEWKCLLL